MFKALGTLIHGVAASEALDSSGERIIISGLDISSLPESGVLNYEHKSDTPSQVVGKILKAKKIFSEADCETPEEIYFWNMVKIPYIYIMGELFDTVGHDGAKEVAALLRYDSQARNAERTGKNVVNFSVEGSKLDKQGQEITRSLARKVTITVAACNKQAIAEIYTPTKEKSPLDFAKSESSGVELIEMKKADITDTSFWLNKKLKKAITAGNSNVAPSNLEGGAALAKEDLSSNLEKMPNFKKILKFVSDKYPDMTKEEASAMAKYMSARQMIRAEESLEKMADMDKSKNVREQRKKVFGTDPNSPRLSPKRQKMMQQIRDFTEKRFNMPLVTASGKRDETGKLREDKNNQPAYDVFSPEGVAKEKKLLDQYKKKGIKRVDPKPSWTNEQLETQPSPDAAIHEIAHMHLAPEGMAPEMFQQLMDQKWGESQSKYGHMQQKKTSGEIQPMSLENPIRREMGLPANRATKPVKENERALDYEGDRFVEGKDSKGKKAFYDRQSRLTTPENRERLTQVREGSLKFHPDKGWYKDSSPDSLINLRGRGQAEEAQARAKERYSQAKPKKMAASEMAKSDAPSTRTGKAIPEHYDHTQHHGFGANDFKDAMDHHYNKAVSTSDPKMKAIHMGNAKKYMQAMNRAPGDVSSRRPEAVAVPKAAIKIPGMSGTTTSAAVNPSSMNPYGNMTNRGFGKTKLAASEMEKAREDKNIIESMRNEYRQKRNEFSGQDPLEREVTSKPGVSERGIEARRADSRQKGSVSHGYMRVDSPEFHKEKAKNYFKQTMNNVRRQERPNLPKSEIAKGGSMYKRCWAGYKPVPGKKPYTKGSCEKE